MEQKEYIEESLQALKETRYPVDYSEQYSAIMAKVEAQPHTLPLTRMLRPLAITAVILLLFAGVWQWSVPVAVSDTTDVFLASSFEIPYSDNEATADGIVSFIEGTSALD